MVFGHLGRVANPLRRIAGAISKGINKSFSRVSLGPMTFDPAPRMTRVGHPVRIVKIPIIGRKGDVLQYMGRPAQTIRLEGEALPNYNTIKRPDAISGSSRLITKKIETPRAFLLEMRFMADILQLWVPLELRTPEFWGIVVIENYDAWSVGGYVDQYHYVIECAESTPFGVF